MHGLTLTYQTLAQSRNEAAVDVLVRSIDHSQGPTRLMAVKALVCRPEPAAARELLVRWDSLGDDEKSAVKAAGQWIEPEVIRVLGLNLGDQADTEDLSKAISAAEQLNLTATIEPLVLVAEACVSRAIRLAATNAIITLVTPLGRAARDGHDRPTVRGPALARLVDSVRRFSMHRNADLVDAFLVISNWGDGDLRQFISERKQSMDLIYDRMAQSTAGGVIELLAGFIRRRNPDQRLIALMQTRTGGDFRDAFLEKVGSEPTGTVTQNLQDMGMPKCCLGGPVRFTETDPRFHSALLQVYSAANSDAVEIMQMAVAALSGGGPGCETTAALAMGRCKELSTDYWMRAAVPIGEDDVEEIAADENASLLQNLIELLEHPEPGVVKAVRRVLAPLHAENMIGPMTKLRPRSRRRLGRVVMRIDGESINRVRDGLRHPVLAKRLDAIAMADALALVDLLTDSFSHISREDHLEARVKAAEVMADAGSQETLKLLEDMMNLPESPVRDAAARAIEKRTASTAS